MDDPIPIADRDRDPEDPLDHTFIGPDPDPLTRPRTVLVVVAGKHIREDVARSETMGDAEEMNNDPTMIRMFDVISVVSMPATFNAEMDMKTRITTKRIRPIALAPENPMAAPMAVPKGTSFCGQCRIRTSDPYLVEVVL